MDKILEVTLLYDFYGELLGEKQRDIFEMHYQNDLSLAEIGEILGVSRQAVFDQLKRAEKALSEYEGKLALVEKFRAAREKLRELKETVGSLEKKGVFGPELSNIRKKAVELEDLL